MERLGDLFSDCMNRQYLNSAWAVTRLCLQVSLIDGLYRYRLLNNALRGIQRTHYIWKNRESLWIALLTRPRMKRGILRYLLVRKLLTRLYNMRTGYVEFRHKHEVRRWAAQCRRYEQRRQKRNSTPESGPPIAKI